MTKRYLVAVVQLCALLLFFLFALALVFAPLILKGASN